VCLARDVAIILCFENVHRCNGSSRWKDCRGIDFKLLSHFRFSMCVMLTQFSPLNDCCVKFGNGEFFMQILLKLDRYVEKLSMKGVTIALYVYGHFTVTYGDTYHFYQNYE